MILIYNLPERKLKTITKHNYEKNSIFKGWNWKKPIKKKQLGWWKLKLKKIHKNNKKNYKTVF
jgi:hypothetical protein